MSKGLTVTAAAAAVGITQGTLVNIEAGRRQPGPEVREAIRALLDVPLDAITYDATDPSCPACGQSLIPDRVGVEVSTLAAPVDAA